jgi:Regulator of ribonuclease activity B
MWGHVLCMRLGGGGPVHAIERIHDPSEADERVLEHLAELGCDLAAPVDVAHYLYLPQRACADAVTRALERRGWETAAGRCDDASYLVVATRRAVLSSPGVGETRRELEALAAAHEGVYDGWEARAE